MSTPTDSIVSEVLSRPARGRKAAHLHAATVRPLAAEDIARLGAQVPGGLTTVRPLQRLRHSHHMLAQLMASGEKQEVCALATGYDPAYISNIKRDPAFKELLAHYASQVEATTLEVAARLRALGLDSIDELQARLAEDPDALTNRELMDLAELAFDRSGHGPSANVSVNARVALVSGVVISRIKEEVAAEATGRSLDLLTRPSPDRVPEVGEILSALALAEGTGADGGAEAGAPVPATRGEDPPK